MTIGFFKYTLFPTFGLSIISLSSGNQVAQEHNSTTGGPLTDADMVHNLLFGKTGSSIKDICNLDDSVNAKCYMLNAPKVYEISRAVLRIRLNNWGLCSAWLLGDEGHIITNNHCMNSQADADQAQFEAMAEGSSCLSDCTGMLACPGTIIHSTPVTFIKTGGHIEDDWTLFQFVRAQELEKMAKSYQLELQQTKESSTQQSEEAYVKGKSEGISQTEQKIQNQTEQLISGHQLTIKKYESQVQTAYTKGQSEASDEMLTLRQKYMELENEHEVVIKNSQDKAYREGMLEAESKTAQMVKEMTEQLTLEHQKEIETYQARIQTAFTEGVSSVKVTEDTVFDTAKEMQSAAHTVQTIENTILSDFTVENNDQVVDSVEKSETSVGHAIEQPLHASNNTETSDPTEITAFPSEKSTAADETEMSAVDETEMLDDEAKEEAHVNVEGDDDWGDEWE